ncbi:MAG: polysaccharide deacetylase family protein [bacterium]|nr:polysaccharide deacetylase family protein [bacterium]
MINLRVASFGNRNKKDIAITFDDGPNPYFTQKILDTLDSFNVKATFFVIGKRCLEYPEILKETKQRGHLIGNHTFSHKGGDFEMCNDEIDRAIGEVSMYVRPPFYDLSFCGKENRYLQDKFIITGDVDSKDYLSISQDEIFKNVLENTKNGSIIDFHDGSEIDDDLKIRAQKTLDILPKIITTLRSQFNLVRIDMMDLQFIYFPKSYI